MQQQTELRARIHEVEAAARAVAVEREDARQKAVAAASRCLQATEAQASLMAAVGEARQKCAQEAEAHRSSIVAAEERIAHAEARATEAERASQGTRESERKMKVEMDRLQQRLAAQAELVASLRGREEHAGAALDDAHAAHDRLQQQLNAQTAQLSELATEVAQVSELKAQAETSQAQAKLQVAEHAKHVSLLQGQLEEQQRTGSERAKRAADRTCR